MATFTGALLKEPIDLASFASERQLLELCDDPDSPDVTSEQLFSELSGTLSTKILAVMNGLITDAEGLVNSYAKAFGYPIPLLDGSGTADPVAKRFSGALVWNDLQRRHRTISGKDWSATFKEIIDSLAMIQKGEILLSLTTTSTNAANEPVIAMGGAERVFSREKLDAM